MVGLAEIHLHARVVGRILDHARNVVQRVMAVDVRLPQAQQVEIGTVENIDGRLVGHAGHSFGLISGAV